jgi:RNA polymerase sigma-32 factor
LPRSPNRPSRGGTGAKPAQPAAPPKRTAKAGRGAKAAAAREPSSEVDTEDPEAEAEEQDDEAPVAEVDSRAEAESERDVESEPEAVDDEGAVRDSKALASWEAKESSDDKASIARSDPLAAYLREVQKHPLLTAEETQSLAQDFVATQDAAKAARLVTANLRLVVKIAYEYRRAYKNILDLIQEGNIGLMQAVKRYDPYRGVKLSSYAAWWIRAYILRFILNNWRLVKLGTTQAQRKLFFNLRKKRAELQALGIDPTDAEVAKQLNVSESDVAEMEVRLQASERSLDAPIGDGEGRATAKIDTMPSSVEGPEALMAGSELQGLLKEKLATFRATLDGKEKDLAIFDQRLVADEPLTLQELGDRFGISRERVRQLEQRLTGKLREFLRDEMGDAVEVA